MSHRNLAALAGLAGLVLTGVPAAAATPAAAPYAPDAPTPDRAAPPSLTITTNGIGAPPVAAGIVGGNQRWLLDADHAWDQQAKQVRPRIIELAKQAGIKAVRYPGGTVANLFDYRHAVGTPGCQTSGGFAFTQFAPIPASKSAYTLPRHDTLMDGIGGRTNLMLPMVNTTPAQAKAFVRAAAKATGQKSFVVEIGNEPYLDNQRYWRASDPKVRLEEYIKGGKRVQPAGSGVYKNNNGLFKVSGCDLLHPESADGSANQVYRPRFTPISLDPAPVITVAGQTWRYVRSLASHGAGARVFTLDKARRTVRFGDGVHGAKPSGTMRIKYAAGRMPGFSDFYQALKSMDDVDVKVCAGWGRPDFVTRMKALGRRYDCLGVHEYANISGVSEFPDVYRKLMAEGDAETAELGQLRRSMRAAGPGAASRFLIVTEFGSLRPPYPQQGQRFLHDILLARLLAGQVANGVPISNLSNFASYFEKYGAGADARFALSSRGYISRLFKQLVGQRPVQVSGSHDGVTVLGTRRGAAAASLLVVNKRWSAGYAPEIRLPGRDAPTCVGIRTLRTDPKTITRPDNADALPKSVRPAKSVLWRAGTTFRPALASHSITLLTFRPKGTAPCPTVTP